jgi:hypothetical protein
VFSSNHYTKPGLSLLCARATNAQVVALSMALTPYLAAFGAKLATMLEKGDVKALQPPEEEMKVGGSDCDCVCDCMCVMREQMKVGGCCALGIHPLSHLSTYPMCDDSTSVPSFQYQIA